MMNGDSNGSLLLSTSPGRRALLMQNSAAPPTASNASESSASAIDSSGSNEEISDKAWVIYDLTKLPPTVRTANSTFCKMLGYEMNEVIGQPWKKFVHPDYYERALQILSARRMNNSLHQPIEFEQVYVHKNGGVFLTIDSHTIVILEGQPVSDVVSIRLAPAPASAKAAATVASKTGSKPAVRGNRSKALQEAHELPITPKRNAPKSARLSTGASPRAQKEQPVFDDSDVVRSGSRRSAQNGDDEFSEYAQRKLENLTLNNGRPTRAARQPAAANSNVFAKSSSASASSSVSSTGLRKPPPRSAKRAAVEVLRHKVRDDDDEEEDATETEPEYPPNAPGLVSADVSGGHHHQDSVLAPENQLMSGGVLLTDTSASSTTNPTNALSDYDHVGGLASATDAALYNSAAPASPSSPLFNFENDLPTWLNDVVSPSPLASTSAPGSSSMSLLSPPPMMGSNSHATSSPLRVGLKESADELATSFNIDDVLSGFLDDQNNNNPPNVSASNNSAALSSSAGLATAGDTR